MKFSMWFVTVTTFALGVSLGSMLPYMQRLAYMIEDYIRTGVWGVLC